MELIELLARFKKFQVAVLVLLVVIVVINVVALRLVITRLNRLDERSPISVSCSGFHGYLPPVDGVREVSTDVDMEYAASGELWAVVTFRLVEKIPNSEVFLAYRFVEGEPGSPYITYRPLGTGEWSRASILPNDDDPLTFRTSIHLGSTGKGLIQYRLEQHVDGEIVHVSDMHYLHVEDLIGGTGDLHVQYSVSPKSPRPARLVLYNWYGLSKIEAFQVAKVRFIINKTSRTEEMTVEGEGQSEFTCSFDPEGLKNVEIIVIYKDGEIRTAIFDPSVPWDEDEPLVIR